MLLSFIILSKLSTLFLMGIENQHIFGRSFAKTTTTISRKVKEKQFVAKIEFLNYLIDLLARRLGIRIVACQAVFGTMPQVSGEFSNILIKIAGNCKISKNFGKSSGKFQLHNCWGSRGTHPEKISKLSQNQRNFLKK